MTTEKLDELKSLKNWIDKILSDYEGLPEALQKAELPVESDFTKLFQEKLEIICTRIDEKINENEPITAEQTAEAKWEADNER